MNNFKPANKTDWEKHWSKHELIRVIPENFSWHENLKHATEQIGGAGSAIELGGFPGNFSVYLKKYCNFDVTLLDYIIDHGVVKELFEINGLKNTDAKLIEADIFSYEPRELYDLVCSFGLIEHFTDLNAVLACHLKFMKPNGILLITLPNFVGVNGWLQYLFDSENLAIHNLKIMDIVMLKNAMTVLGMKNIEVQYYPSTQVWLEGLRYRSLFLRIFVRLVNELLFILGKVFGKRNKLFSNSIVISAKLR